jgi:hypothetical protein
MLSTDDFRQQFLAGQVIDAGIKEYVIQHEFGQETEFGVLRRPR